MPVLLDEGVKLALEELDWLVEAVPVLLDEGVKLALEELDWLVEGVPVWLLLPVPDLL